MTPVVDVVVTPVVDVVVTPVVDVVVSPVAVVELLLVAAVVPPELPPVLVPSSMTVVPQMVAIASLAKHVGSPFKEPTISDGSEQ